MNAHLWWYVARASGIVSWALLSLVVIWGLLLTTRVLQGRPTPRWLLDLHSYLGGLAVVFVGVHVAALVADSTVHFGLTEVLVPLASRWRPWPVALGVVAGELAVAVQLTSLLRRRLPRRAWRVVHRSSFVAFWAATLHGVLAGSDTTHPALWPTYLVGGGLVLGLTLVRVGARPRTATAGAGVTGPERPAPR